MTVNHLGMMITPWREVTAHWEHKQMCKFGKRRSITGGFCLQSGHYLQGFTAQNAANAEGKVNSIPNNYTVNTFLTDFKGLCFKKMCTP